MIKINLTTMSIIILMFSVVFCHSAIRMEGLIIPKSRSDNNHQDLELYFFNKAISKFNAKTIAEKVTAYQAFPNGTIYCMAKSTTLYKEKLLPDFGIKVIYIKEPNDFYHISSGIAINIDTNEMYFPKNRRVKFNLLPTELYKLNFKTGKETKLTSGYKFTFIGIPALSPDKKKIAFYCSLPHASRHYGLQVAVYDIESKMTKIVAPPSVPFMPYGPDMGGSPVWNNDSSEIYFMAIYPKTKKIIPFDTGVYKVSIKDTKQPKLICKGGFPMRSDNSISCTRINNAKKGADIWHISPLPKKLIYRNVGFGKISPSGTLIAFRFKSGFYACKIDDKNKILLKSDSSWPDATWIKLEPNNAVNQNRQWYLTPTQAIALAEKANTIKYDKSLPLTIELRKRTYSIRIPNKVRKNAKGNIIETHYGGVLKIDAQTGKVLQRLIATDNGWKTLKIKGSQ